MKNPSLVVFSLGLVFGIAFSAAATAQKAPDQSGQFKVTPEFSDAENIVEALAGMSATDPESQAKLQQARAVFQAALDQFPNSTLALKYLGRTYSFSGQDMALGIATFEKCLAIDANQPDVIVRLIDLHLKVGQRSKAAEAQARLVNRVANPELATKVERLIAQWDVNKGQRLVKEGHPDEGLALIDKTIQDSSDPGVQESLREMRKKISREWEVSFYNDALAKVKAGDYHGALNMLEKLLPLAKDPEVVERAKRLRDKLAPAVGQGTSK
jgi:tetratricopeptide (TPR) repeat protein